MVFTPIAGLYHKEDQSSKIANQDNSFKIKCLSVSSRKALILKFLPVFFVKDLIRDNK